MPEPITFAVDLHTAYNEQYSDDLTAWRELGAKYKAQNIIAVCQGYYFTHVLECGAGEGSLLFHLDRNNFTPELHAVEISRSGIAAIQRRNIPSVRSILQFNGYHLPYQDKRFDLVVLSHVLEHVEHPRLLLREVKRVSRYQVIEVPLDYSPCVDRRVGYYLEYGHINIFTPALVRFLLKSEGFTLVRDRYDPEHGEVVQFQQYHLQARPKTLKTELRRRAIASAVALRRRLTPVVQRQERRYNAYCVLCEDTGTNLRIF